MTYARENAFEVVKSSEALVRLSGIAIATRQGTRHFSGRTRQAARIAEGDNDEEAVNLWKRLLRIGPESKDEITGSGNALQKAAPWQQQDPIKIWERKLFCLLTPASSLPPAPDSIHPRFRCP